MRYEKITLYICLTLMVLAICATVLFADVGKCGGCPLLGSKTDCPPTDSIGKKVNNEDIIGGRVIVFDKDKQAVKTPEIVAKVTEILEMNLSDEETQEHIKKLAEETGYDIVLLNSEKP